MLLARIAVSENFDMPPVKELEDPEIRFGVHQPESKNMLVEMRQLAGAACSRAAPAKARDLHARQYHHDQGGACQHPGSASSSAALGVLGQPLSPVARLSGRRGYRALLHGGYVDAVMVRPREAADQAAARAFLARHDSLRAARLGELVHPLDHPALVAETAGGQLLGMLTYVPGRDWKQCEILTLHADEQWHGTGTALIEAVRLLARRQGCTRLWVITTNDNVDTLRFYQRRGFRPGGGAPRCR